MLNGFVNSRGEPFVRIELYSSDNHLYRIPAVIDTGFNGNLSIPEKLATHYAWRWIGYESYEIATGDIVQEKVFWGKIRWFGQIQDVYALASRAEDVLIGTRLLYQNRLLIDFPRKKVKIS